MFTSVFKLVTIEHFIEILSGKIDRGLECRGKSQLYARSSEFCAVCGALPRIYDSVDISGVQSLFS